MAIISNNTNNDSINKANNDGIPNCIDDNYCFGRITAFRDEYSLQQNFERNMRLESHIRRLRFGFKRIAGSFDGGSQAENEFYIVFSMPDRQEELRNFLKSACLYFNQDDFLFVADGKTSIWHQNG